ncbi:MAG: hypothetical protein ACTSVT_04550 [Candidatus Thorarchaeota archaeon]
MSSAREIKLALVGLPKSGKTVYIGMLAYYIVVKYSQYYTIEADPDTREYLDDIATFITVNKKFPPATNRGTVKKIEFDIVASSRRVTIRTVDMSGEDYRLVATPSSSGNPVSVFRRLCQKYGEEQALRSIEARFGSNVASVFRKYFSIIKQSDAYILMVDPLADSEDDLLDTAVQDSFIAATLSVIRESLKGDKPRPVAVVISKWDLVDSMGNKTPSPADLARELLVAARSDLSTYRPLTFFGVSAVGTTKSERDDKGVVIRVPDVVRPVGLIDPIRWILKNT